MNNARRSPPDPPGKGQSDDQGLPESDYVRESLGPPLKDPRSRAAIDNIGVDDQADLLDVELDDQPGDFGAGGRSLLDDVRSDSNDDERNENR